MSKRPLTVFLCTSKDCTKEWSRVCKGSSPGKWLKRLIKEAGLPYKLHIIKTECMDRCEEAANVCIADGNTCFWEACIRSHHDADRLLASMRASVESGAEVPAEHGGSANRR